MRQDCKGHKAEEAKILLKVCELIEDMKKHTETRSNIDQTFKSRAPAARDETALLIVYMLTLKEARKKHKCATAEVAS